MNIAELKKLAGIGEKQNEPSMGENISHTATALKHKEKQLGLKPGDDEWFKFGLEDHICKVHTKDSKVERNENKKHITRV